MRKTKHKRKDNVRKRLIVDILNKLVKYANLLVKRSYNLRQKHLLHHFKKINADLKHKYSLEKNVERLKMLTTGEILQEEVSERFVSFGSESEDKEYNRRTYEIVVRENISEINQFLSRSMDYFVKECYLKFPAEFLSDFNVEKCSFFEQLLEKNERQRDDLKALVNYHFNTNV